MSKFDKELHVACVSCLNKVAEDGKIRLYNKENSKDITYKTFKNTEDLAKEVLRYGVFEYKIIYAKTKSPTKCAIVFKSDAINRYEVYHNISPNLKTIKP